MNDRERLERAKAELAVTRQHWCYTNATVFIENHADGLLEMAERREEAEARAAHYAGECDKAEARCARYREALERAVKLAERCIHVMDDQMLDELDKARSVLAESSSAAAKPRQGIGTEDEEPKDSSLEDYTRDKQAGYYAHILGCPTCGGQGVVTIPGPGDDGSRDHDVEVKCPRCGG